MPLRRFDIAAVITLAVGAIGAAYFIGSLDARVKSIEEIPTLDEVRSAGQDALGALERKAEDSLRGYPIGAVIDYVGPIESDKVGADAGHLLESQDVVWAKGHPEWVVCNGATLSEDDVSPDILAFDADDTPGFQVPDLRSRFTKGVAKLDEVGRSGGKRTQEIQVGHTHGIAPCGGASSSNALQAQAWHEHVPSCNERASTVTRESSVASIAVEHDPPYVGVLKIVRVR